MASHPHTPLGLIFGLSLIALLACQSGASEKQANSNPPTLQYRNGQLTYIKAGQSHQLTTKSPVPYRIVVSSSSYSLVTTAGADLEVATYSTDYVNVRRFADMLPQLVKPPVCALFGLANSEVDAATGVVLLGGRGEEIWRSASADLLWPATGAPRSDAFCITAGSDTNPLGIYGLGPALVRVDCKPGKELWRKAIPAEEYVEDAIIYGIGSTRGLLCLQYGTDLFEFFTFDIASGIMQSIYMLDGTPLYRSIYPGPIPEPIDVSLKGDSLSLIVIKLDGGWQKLTFDLARDSVKSAKTQSQALLGERNPHPHGGSDVAKPPLFPQGILPMQSGASWTIPALVNAQGQVFVATADGASWITP